MVICQAFILLLILFDYTMGYGFPHHYLNHLNFYLRKIRIRMYDQINNDQLPWYNKIDSGMSRFVARVAYDGHDFSGFQYQLNARSVQAQIEEALERVFRRPSRIVAAGRTDSFVSARGQVIHFHAPHQWTTKTSDLNRIINHNLPSSVCLWNVSVVPHIANRPWHANIDCKRKLYCYRFRCSPYSNPLDNKFRFQWNEDVSKVKVIKNSVNEFLGTQNFKSFGNHNGKEGLNIEKDYRRTISRIDVIKENSEYSQQDFRVDFELTGALYKMVRNIMGMLFAIGEGRFDVKDVQKVFSFEDRALNPIGPAPPHGLTLEHVFYDNY